MTTGGLILTGRGACQTLAREITESVLAHDMRTNQPFGKGTCCTKSKNSAKGTNQKGGSVTKCVQPRVRICLYYFRLVFTAGLAAGSDFLGLFCECEDADARMRGCEDADVRRPLISYTGRQAKE